MTTFSLKLTAVVLMTLDHVGLYFPAAPACLRWLGRGAYPLFLTGYLISAVETFQRDRKRGGLLLGTAALVQVFYGLLPSLLPFARNLSGDVLTGLVPNLAVNEFGFEFIALGLALYFLRDRREALTAVYLIFCIYQFSAEALYGVFPVQWMMVLALPLILRYNGERGRGWKPFFYVYYPAHTCLLFLLARSLG